MLMIYLAPRQFYLGTWAETRLSFNIYYYCNLSNTPSEAYFSHPILRSAALIERGLIVREQQSLVILGQ